MMKKSGNFKSGFFWTDRSRSYILLALNLAAFFERVFHNFHRIMYINTDQFSLFFLEAVLFELCHLEYKPIMDRFTERNFFQLFQKIQLF